MKKGRYEDVDVATVEGKYEKASTKDLVSILKLFEPLPFFNTAEKKPNSPNCFR